jgi:transposase InsO family protein
VSIGGLKYYISFTDNCSRCCTPLFMKNKYEASDKIKEYITHVERKFGTMPKYLQVDNGKELISQKVKDWLKSKGIELQNSAPYSLEQMGVAE